MEARDAEHVRERLTEIIDLADHDALDLLRSRACGQEVWTYWMNPRPGEVWLADLGLAAKTRPVVSRFDPEAPRALVIYVPLTTRNREGSYEVPVPKLGFLNAALVANMQGIPSIPLVRLE